MNNFETAKDVGSHLRSNNQIQIELVKRQKTDGNIEDALMVWANNYSAKFREVLERKLSENSNFWTDLENPELREKMLQEIESELYQDDSLEKLAA